MKVVDNVGVELKGKKILIVGGLNKFKERYRQIIEKLGGNPRWIQGDILGSKAKVAINSDIIIFVIAGMKHDTQERILSLCKKKIEIINVNSLGISGFRNKIKELSK